MPHRYVWTPLRDFVIHRILRLDDTPHRIALGVAIGIFVTWTPTIGLQMVLVLALAALLRANKVVGVPLVWLSNPLTLVPVYGPNYWVGMKLLGGRYTWQGFLDAMDHAAQPQDSWWATVSQWFEAVERVAWPLWTGSILVATVLGAACYLLAYYGVLAYRRRHPHEPEVSSREGDA